MAWHHISFDVQASSPAEALAIWRKIEQTLAESGPHLIADAFVGSPTSCDLCGNSVQSNTRGHYCDSCLQVEEDLPDEW